jgi:hypothetical protein
MRYQSGKSDNVFAIRGVYPAESGTRAPNASGTSQTYDMLE